MAHTKLMSGVALAIACWNSPLPASAHPLAAIVPSAIGAAGMPHHEHGDSKDEHGDHDDNADKGERGERGEHGDSDKGGQGDACCNGSCECGEDQEKGEKGQMGGRMGMRGHMGMDDHMGMGGHMGMGMKMEGRMGPEIRYMPSMWTTGGNQYLILGGGMQKGDGIFSMGLQHNIAIQMFNGSSAGNWVAPYCGILPRIGMSVDKARVDVGLLGGFGLMARTRGDLLPGAQVLDTRFQWVLEPRIEVGFRGEHMGVSLVGAYLMTPNMADFGGASVGLKFSFKGPHK